MQQPPDQIIDVFGTDSLDRLVPVEQFRERENLSADDYLALETPKQVPV